MSLHIAPANCNNLIRRSIDLRRLYRRAAVMCEPGLRVVLNENAQTLHLLIVDLQALSRASGAKPSEHGSWRGVAREHLAGLLLHAGTRRDDAWIRALAHHERALLHAFEQAIADAPTESALALRRQLPRLHGIHLDMHSLTGTARY